MNKKIASLILLVMAITINCLISIGYGIAGSVTKERAIEIANNEVEKLGRDVDSLQIEATKYNTPWNKYIPKNDKEYAADRGKLKNKQYWAVYYHYPIEMHIKGGDICIFIEYNTGKVINIIRWR